MAAPKREDARDRIERLRAEIRRHERLYYVEHAPVLSDAEFDRLYAELVALEREHPELASPDSPTQRVGPELSGGFETAPHAVPMLSMDNTYSEEELRAFDERVARLLEDAPRPYVAELKIDGAGVSLRYERGRFARGLTRGDGRVGEVITANLRTIRALPLVLDAAGRARVPDLLEVRGEVYLPRSEFARINEERQESGEPPFANPRNAAAGALKQLDPSVAASRSLSLFVYEVAGVDADFPTASHWKKIEALAALGLPVNPARARCEGLDEVLAFANEWRERRRGLDYDTDGVVVKVDAAGQRERLGHTAKSPRWMVAYKYAPEEVETKLLRIEIQVGKTGVLSPVGKLEPVQLAGTTVKSVLLHNQDEIDKKDVRINDTVVVHKAGEIIPQVVRVVKEKRPKGAKKYRMPKKCPACGAAAQRREGEVALRCTNANCPARVYQRIVYFAGRGVMDIEGLGPVWVNRLLEAKLIADVADLYDRDKINAENLRQFFKDEGKGRSDEELVSAQNLIKAIDESRTRPLWRLLTGLGIPLAGSEMCRQLADHFGSLDRILNAPPEEMKKLFKEEEVSRNAQAVHDHLRRAGDDLFSASGAADVFGYVMGLEVPGIGEAKAKKLAEAFRTVPELRRASLESLSRAFKKEQPKKIAESIYAYFQNPQNREIVRKLQAHDVAPASAERAGEAHPAFAGRTFVVTGTLEGYSREEAQALIRSLGGKAASSVSKRTDYLLAGASPGSKLEKARKLGVRVLSEEAFERLRGSG